MVTKDVPRECDCGGQSRKVSEICERGEKVEYGQPTKIPFLDLVTPHQDLEAELLAVVKKAFDARWVYRWADGRRI